MTTMSVHDDASDTFLPVRFDSLNKWLGHQAGTRLRLSNILSVGASRAGGLSLAERTLLAASACWSAVSARTLLAHLGPDPVCRLRSLANVYAAIGAKRSARLMELAIAELHGAASEAQRQRCLEDLEIALLKTRAKVDDVLRQLSLRLTPAPAAPGNRLAALAQSPHIAALSLRPTRGGSRVDRLVAASVRWRTENHATRQEYRPLQST